MAYTIQLSTENPTLVTEEDGITPVMGTKVYHVPSEQAIKLEETQLANPTVDDIVTTFEGKVTREITPRAGRYLYAVALYSGQTLRVW